MSNIVGKMLSVVHRKIDFYHKDLVHIEGGLGSQILGALVFWNLQEKLGNQNVYCDLSYFSEGADKKGLWSYQLNRFNLQLSDFEKYEKKSKRNLLKAKRDFLNDEELSKNYWQLARDRYKNRFTFDSDGIHAYFEDVAQINTYESYAAVHVRRGDYVQVASKLIQFEEYFSLISSITKLFPFQVVVISDSEVSRENKDKLQHLLKDNKVTYLDSPEMDSFKLHCLLREAEILITANSTYSFSAGLLGRQGQIVISPMQFHSGEGSEKYNKTFQSAGSFFIWPQRD